MLDRELSGANREAEAAFTKAVEAEAAKEAAENAASAKEEDVKTKK